MPIENAQAKGQIIKRLLDNAKKARKEFIETGREIEKYGFSRNYDFEYSAAKEEMFFKAKVAKTAQFIDIVGSSLYQTNPDRRVNPRPWVNDQQRARAKIMEQYLNYTPDECDLYGHSRRSVVEGLVYGRGVMWTGWNERKKLVQSVNDTVDNLLVDPDARIQEEMGWVSRRRVRPRIELLKKFPDPAAQQIIKEIEATKERNSDRDAESWERRDYGADQIEFYECYFRWGLARYKGGIELAKPAVGDDSAAPMEADDSPLKYYVSSDGDLFAEEEWEIPFFLDDEWPCTLLDYRERPGCIWPVSPLEVGLGHQKALNWLYTLYLSKARFTTRTLIAAVTQNGQGLNIEAEHKALYGRAIEIIKLAVNGDQGKLDHYLQQLDFKLNVEEFVALQEIISREFEQSTGLSEFLMTGGGNTQARSAEEVKIKDQKSRTRIEDYLALTEKWASKIARKEALAARYLCDPEDILPIFGQQAAALWGQLMPPLREQMAMVKAGKMDLSALSEQGVVMEEWVRECDYEIVSGSMRRKDIDQAIDAADAAMNQLVPALIQEGGAGPAAAIIADWADKKGLNPAVGQAILQWAQAKEQQQQIQDQLQLANLQMQQQQLAMQQQQMMAPQPPQGPQGAPMPPPQPGQL